MATALPTNIALGTILSWSMFNLPLTANIGVVAPSAHDWALTSVAPVFGVYGAAFGVAATIFGNWIQKAGARTSVTISAILFGGGFLLGE